MLFLWVNYLSIVFNAVTFYRDLRQCEGKRQFISLQVNECLPESNGGAARGPSNLEITGFYGDF